MDGCRGAFTADLFCVFSITLNLYCCLYASRDGDDFVADCDGADGVDCGGHWGLFGLESAMVVVVLRVGVVRSVRLWVVEVGVVVLCLCVAGWGSKVLFFYHVVACVPGRARACCVACVDGVGLVFARRGTPSAASSVQAQQ